MRRLRTALALAAVAALVMSVPVGATGPVRRSAVSTDSTATRATVDRAYALVQLKGEPLATYVKTKPAPGKKIDLASSTTKAYRAQLAALRNDFKKWLSVNAPKARVTGGWDISLNAVSVRLNGTTLTRLRTAPLVARAEYQGLYYPTDADPDLGIIDAIDAWAANGGSAATAGEGVEVAIVDTGIDQTHPCFADAGYPTHVRFGAASLTNNKVIAARVFNNKAVSRGYTAGAVQDHGTHVAGTVACNFETPAIVHGVDIPYDVSGVAPRALLGNYNVFPGDVANARSEDILNALEAAYADGMDVANMSLGGGASGIQDLLTMAVDNLDRANMVVAVAAGNSGPGRYTVESPGSAARALTAGASSVPHFVGAPLTLDGTTYGAATGDFEVASVDITAPLGVVTGTVNGLGTACSALPAGSLAGKIALISRGSCTFSAKIRNAANAGAVAVLVVNNVAGDPVAMGSDETPDQPEAPAYMVGWATGQAIRGSEGASTTIGVALSYYLTPNVDIMAGFSSQGPTDVDFRVKPDVVAPGVNVLSSIPCPRATNGIVLPGCGGDGSWAFFQGTSMATPHLAGSAAVVRSQHPSWSAAQVRSAVVNTAERSVLKDHRFGMPVPNSSPPATYGHVTDVNIQGAGRENLLAAVNATVAIEPVSVSFGAIPSGAGQTKTIAVRLTNLSGAPISWALAITGTPGSGVTFSADPSVNLDIGESTTVNVTMTATRSAGFGGHQAWLTVSSGGTEIAHAAVYTLVK